MLSTERLFSFQYNGTPFWDLPYTVTKETEGNVTRTRYALSDGFCVTVCRTDYPKEGAVEWVNTFSNEGTALSGRVTELFDTDVTLPFPHEDPKPNTAYVPDRDRATKIYAPLGSTWSPDEFTCQVDRLEEARRQNHIYPGERRSYAPVGGRSAHTRAPFLQVYKENRGVVAAIGWSGQWNAHVERGTDSLRLLWGVEGAAFRVLPGETFRTASAVLLPYEGTPAHGRVLWRRLMKRHFSLIGKEGRDAQGPLCAMLWGGMRSESILKRLDLIEKHALPYEYAWIDAGWYGENTKPTPDEFEGDWPVHAGEWVISSHIHPNQLKDVSDRCHKMGMKLLLWVEPERAWRGTPVTVEHPEYFIESPHDQNQLLLNLANPEAEKY
ncbi:MAG: alpha-galactosidase, partial [Clostridia bacterium]|nr:alpha-galactosidase [Clostridia bacterium]